LLDDKGAPKLSVREDIMADCDRDCLAIALRTRQVVSSDLYRTQPEALVHHDLYTPLVLPGSSNNQTVGVLVLRIDPYEFLCPLRVVMADSEPVF
jgi:hypothetical protein